MSALLEVDQDNRCNWRPTPWDARALGFPTADISALRHRQRLAELFDLVEAKNLENGIGLCYFRHDANDLAVKGMALERGFLATEFSLGVFHNDIGKIASVPRFTFLRLEKENSEEVRLVKELVGDSFAHGRFHEDPLVDREVAGRRYRLWIDDLLESAHCYIFKVRGKVGGFFTYRVEDDCLDLPLTGLAAETRGLGGFFWTNLFSFIHEQTGVKKTRLLISGANTDVLNLYARLGFSFGDPVFGYHKHYRK